MIPPEQRTAALAWIGAFLTLFGCIAMMSDCCKQQSDNNRAQGYATDMFGNTVTVSSTYQAAVRADSPGFGKPVEAEVAK